MTVKKNGHVNVNYLRGDFKVLLGFPITPDKFSDVFVLASKVEKFQIFLGNG